MIRHTTMAAVLACIAIAPAHAQQAPFKLALQPTAMPITVTHDVVYGRADTTALRMDVYRPTGAATVRRPALVFFNRAVGAGRAGEYYVAWARAAASRGLVAIIPDLRDGSEARDAEALLDHLVARGAEVGVEPDAIAVYAASGNVWAALPFLEDPRRTAVKSVVIYYGAAQVSEFRRDLPLLWVRAGLDRPALNREIDRLAALAVTQNAPVTLLNHATGHHAFEARNDDDATRRVMEETIEFVRRTTTREHQAALRTGARVATAAGHVIAGEHAKAAALYRELLDARADDHLMRLAYGEALLGDRQFAAACAEFEKLKGKGLGYRDLGLPAARACMQKGDADAAIAWLKSIPSRYLPGDVRDEPVFAPLREREEFRALFAGR